MAEIPKSYCDYVKNLPDSDINKKYHDYEYGFPLLDDNALFGRLILEINQAGLSWTTILKKKENFYTAYSEFNIQKVANYNESDRQRLLNDSGIIRNQLKIDAAIHNAMIIIDIQNQFCSFKNWLDEHQSLDKASWIKLFKKTFRFTGGEITSEFLMSTGYLPGAHVPECPIYQKLKEI